MSITRKLVAPGLIIALAGNAGCETSQDAGHDAHTGPVMNYHRIDARLVTGGHLVGNGMQTLKSEGIKVVIDLRDQPPEGQEERLAEAGIRWVNVPVVWKAPQPEDFEAFSRLMSENEGENILVQCQANYRASAMTYLYRVTQAGVPEPEARKDLNAVWTPEGTWQEYIEDVLDAEQRKSGQQ